VWLWSVSGAQAAQWVSRRLARNQRVLVAAPGYLQQHGTPAQVQGLSKHACLIARENGNKTNQPFEEWHLQRQSGAKKSSPDISRIQVNGPLSSNSGELVRDWCLDGRGIMLRSLWDIAPQLQSGQLTRVLPDWCMPDADIHWLAPYRPDAPRRIRLLIDFLVAEFASEPWKTTMKSDVKTSQPARPGSRPKR
jgi:LysR family transcriptional regulator, transcriptional activator for dmlA